MVFGVVMSSYEIWLCERVRLCELASYYRSSNWCGYLMIYTDCGYVRHGKSKVRFGFHLLSPQILSPNYALVTFNPMRRARYVINYGHKQYLRSHIVKYRRDAIEYSLTWPVGEFGCRIDMIAKSFTMYQSQFYHENLNQSASLSPVSVLF